MSFRPANQRNLAIFFNRNICSDVILFSLVDEVGLIFLQVRQERTGEAVRDHSTTYISSSI
jgi:hypothetical protein